MRTVAQWHEAAPPGTVSLVPVVVDDLDAALSFFAPLSHELGGVVLDCRDADLDGPVPSTADPVLRAAVTSQLRDGTGRYVDITDLSGDLIDAQWQNPASGPTPSGGERTVLALARAVLHQDWVNREFVVIAYPGSVIDLPFQARAWGLGTQHLRHLPHPTVRTVVYLVESALSVSIHGDVDTGFSLALDGQRLLRRTGRDNLNGWARVLADDPQGVVLFLGAGFSASSRLPLGNGLRDSAIKRLLGIEDSSFIDSMELARRFHTWVRPRHGWLTSAEERLTELQYATTLTLEQVIRAEQHIFPELPTLQAFSRRHAQVISAPGPAVVDLGEMLTTAASRRLILTGVNFDEMVEAHTPAPLRVFATDADFADAPNYLVDYYAGRVTDIPYLKLHGTIGNLESCVVSAEQTERGLSQPKLDAVRALFPTASGQVRRWVYVGASMRDRDLARVFQESDFATRTDELWVAPWLVDTVEDYMRSRESFWRDRPHKRGDDRLISATADAFLDALRRVW